MKKLHVTVVMPAYNAEQTLEKTLKDIPKNSIDTILLVDDSSKDATVPLAKSLGIKVIKHPQNRGYGANQKTCYTQALSQGTDIVIMLHPDYQYDPQLIPDLIKPIQDGRVDIMLGSRIRSRQEALDGGMPYYKYIGNRFLTLLENIVLGLNLSEYHTGYRAFHKDVLTKIPFHRYSDDFVFDQEIIFGAIAHRARIGEIAVPVRYMPEASSINLKRSITYGLSILKDIVFYLSTRGKYFA